jgi:hypothetical protein
LLPYAGYFIRNTSGSSRALYLPYVRAELMPSGSAPVMTPRVDFWQAQLSLEAGAVSDVSNFFGVRDEASDGRDRYDFSEPPTPPGDFVSLSFENMDADGQPVLFAGDYRKPNSGWTFDVLLRGNVDALSKLRMTDVSLLPSEFSVVLLDTTTGESWSIPRDGMLTLPRRLTANGLRYRLSVGDEDFIAGQVESDKPLPDTYRLFQNYPNPFNPSTTIAFDLPVASPVRLDIFNILGQRIVTLVDQNLPAGKHNVTWDGHDGENRSVASGVYFYRIKAGDFEAKRKMMLLK